MCLGRHLNKRSIQMNGNTQHAHLFIYTLSGQVPPGTSVYKIKQLFTQCITINALLKEYKLRH